MVQNTQIDRQVLTLAVPSNTAWQAERVDQLMMTFYTAQMPLNLIIRAKDKSIIWQIEVGQTYKQAVINGLRAVYPGLQIQETPKTLFDIDFYLYHVETVMPFIFPMKRA